MNILDEHVWIPVIMGRSFVEGFGFTLCFDLSRSRDLDLLYDLLCLSRSRSRSLSLSLDFTLSRSTDLRIFRKFNVCECQRGMINLLKKNLQMYRRLLSRERLLRRSLSRSRSRDRSLRLPGDGVRLRPIL